MAIGIDLGTCFTLSAYIKDGNPMIIPNTYGNRLTPSCVAISNSEILIGEDAVYVKNDPDYVFIEKSKINIGTKEKYKTPQGIFTPEDIAYIILKHTIEYSELYLGATISEAVVTVPAYFNAKQRKLTKEAAEKTGVKVLRIISEPTSASLATNGISKGSNILVYDFGGGTFDCSILQYNNDWAQVISTNGNINLGGKNIDECIVKHILPGINKNHQSYGKLVSMCEAAKKILSSKEEVVINLKEIFPNFDKVKLSYKDFKSITKDIINKTKGCIYECIKDSGLEIKEINHVLLVGGSSRLRPVQELLEQIFNKKPIFLNNPDESVALGAAIHAHELSEKDYKTLVIDIIPMSLSVKVDNGMCKKIILKNSPIPISKTEIFTTAYDNQESVVVEVYQGENELAKNNHFIGQITLDNIKKDVRGEPKIHVGFDIDANASLQVTVRDDDTGSINIATLDYDENKDIEMIDEETEIIIVNLKNKLKTLIYRPNLQQEHLEMIDYALHNNNIEILQSTIQEIESL